MSHSTLSHLALAEKTRREILHKSDLIPPLPDLVTRLLTVLNNQATEPADLERLMQNDQVLVAKMLALVNSPFYGMNRSIRTVKEAVMVLGFRGVRSLVLATSTAKLMQRDFGCYGHEPKGLWLHAASVAAGAKALAKACKMGSNDAEQLFVCGLLHDIGKLLLASHLVGHQRETLCPGGSITEFERRAIGIDHTEAGALVTAKWNLAADIQDLIKGHHDEATTPIGKPMAVVRLADAVAHKRGIGYLPGKSPAPKVLAGDLVAVGLSADAWSATADGIAATMDEAVTALSSLGN